MLNGLLEIESAAASVDEAVAQGLCTFGCSRAEVDITILQTPDRGFLRLLRRRQALVHLRLCDRAFIARRIAAQLLQLAAIPGRVEVIPFSRQIELHIEGDSPGLVIGRRGQTLDALQLLVSLLTDRVTVDRLPIVISAGSVQSRGFGEPCVDGTPPPPVARCSAGMSSTLKPAVNPKAPEPSRLDAKDSHRPRRTGMSQGGHKATRYE